MKYLVVLVSVVSAAACTKSATVDSPSSDGVATTADADGAAVDTKPVVVASRPQLPATIAPQAAATEPSYVVKGCASATRSATVRETDGDDIQESVNISSNAAGVTVSHKVPHACCLKGAVETSVEGGVVTVREVLSGNPCRCMCGSGIETSVPLAAGDYEVKVVLVQPNSKPRDITSKKVTIKAAQ